MEENTSKFENHYWCGIRYASLKQHPLLNRRVALVGLLRAFRSMRNVEINNYPTDSLFIVGGVHPTAFGDNLLHSSSTSFRQRAERMIAEAFNGGVVVDGNRVFEVLQKRLDDWKMGIALPPINESVKAFNGLFESLDKSNPFLMLKSYQAIETRLETAALLAEEKGQKETAIAQLKKKEIERVLQQGSKRVARFLKAQEPGSPAAASKASLSPVAILWAVTFLATFLLLAISALVAAAWSTLIAIVFWAVRHKLAARNDDNPQGDQQSNLQGYSRMVFSPLSKDLLEFCVVSESAHIYSLEERRARGVLSEIRNSPIAARTNALRGTLESLIDDLSFEHGQMRGAAIVELDPCCAELGGKQLAQSLFDRRVSEEKLPAFWNSVHQAFAQKSGEMIVETLSDAAADVAFVEQSLISAALGEIQPFELSETMNVLLEDFPDGNERLTKALIGLKEAVNSVIQLRRRANIDAGLSPMVLSIGLPDGAKDTHVDLIKDVFPGSTIYEGFDASAIEVVFDVSNLSSGQLESYRSTEEPYEAAGEYERRRLFHFPPMPQDKVCLPQPQEPSRAHDSNLTDEMIDEPTFEKREPLIAQRPIGRH